MISKKSKSASNKKLVVAVLLLLGLIGVASGSLVAFFSDYITGNGTVTAGTLDIDGTYEYFVNGSSAAVTSVPNFNPGDVIVVKATVANNGNKSAWLQDVVDFGTLNSAIEPFIKVCEGELTASACAGTTGLTLTAGKYTSSAQIILNGTGAGAEVETTGTGAPVNGLSTHSAAYTIYFDTAALNAAQGKVVTVTARTNALQYRNNPTPNWAGTIEQL